MHCDCFKNIKNSIFLDYNLPAKNVKIKKSFENLYAYGIFKSYNLISLTSNPFNYLSAIPMYMDHILMQI